MAKDDANATIDAIATWTSDGFDPPWSDYIGRFAIDESITQQLIEAYCNINGPRRFKDIDLARLNLRRALCQLMRTEVVQATLDDPPKRLHRDTDLPLICGYLGQIVLPVIVKNYEAPEAKDVQKKLTLRAMAQMLTWDESLSVVIGDKLEQWLANFAMQNRLINGLLIAVAQLVAKPPSGLTDLIDESTTMSQYFDDQQQLEGLMEKSLLFAG